MNVDETDEIRFETYFLGKMIIIKLKTQCSSIHQPTTHTFYTHREANRESLTKQMFVFSDCGSSCRKPVPTQGGPVISTEKGWSWK